MEEEAVFFAALGVAAKLQAAQGEVSTAPDFDRGFEQRGQRGSMAVKDMLVQTLPKSAG